MENIQLEGRIIESYHGRNIDTAPTLLARCDKGEGVILSESDTRFLGVKNFKNTPECIANNYWNTSTLSATKRKTVKVILPYETGNRVLTESARFGLNLINPNEILAHYGVDLDIGSRWEKLNGNEVYTRERDEWFEKGERGVLVGLNEDMTKEQAERCPLLLTKLGHPDYVDSKFARSKDEVAETIGKTFELGKKEYGHNTMMAQSLPSVSDKGVLKTCYVYRLSNRAGSDAETGLDYDNGRFAFYNFGDVKTNRRLTTDQIYSVIENYIDARDKQDVKKAINNLTSQ